MKSLKVIILKQKGKLMFNWDMLFQNKEREERIRYTQKNLQDNMQKTIELMNNITEGLQRLTDTYKEDKAMGLNGLKKIFLTSSEKTEQLKKEV